MVSKAHGPSGYHVKSKRTVSLPYCEYQYRKGSTNAFHRQAGLYSAYALNPCCIRDPDSFARALESLTATTCIDLDEIGCPLHRMGTVDIAIYVWRKLLIGVTYALSLKGLRFHLSRGLTAYRLSLWTGGQNHASRVISVNWASEDQH